MKWLLKCFTSIFLPYVLKMIDLNKALELVVVLVSIRFLIITLSFCRCLNNIFNIVFSFNFLKWEIFQTSTLLFKWTDNHQYCMNQFWFVNELHSWFLYVSKNIYNVSILEIIYSFPMWYNTDAAYSYNWNIGNIE